MSPWAGSVQGSGGHRLREELLARPPAIWQYLGKQRSSHSNSTGSSGDSGGTDAERLRWGRGWGVTLSLFDRLLFLFRFVEVGIMLECPALCSAQEGTIGLWGQWWW